MSYLLSYEEAIKENIKLKQKLNERRNDELDRFCERMINAMTASNENLSKDQLSNLLINYCKMTNRELPKFNICLE